MTQFDWLLMKVKHFEGLGHGVVNMALSILDKAKEGHFLLITGQSRTGKSHLVNEIAHKLLRDGKSICIQLELLVADDA